MGNQLAREQEQLKNLNCKYTFISRLFQSTDCHMRTSSSLLFHTYHFSLL